MINSMTGYGEAQLETAEFSLLVEIRSLNNRFLKTVIKVPESFGYAEPLIERMLRTKLQRGSINYTLHFNYHADTGTLEINQAVMQHYLSHLDQVKILHGAGEGLSIDLSTLLQIPGICQLRTFSEEQQQHFLEHIQKLTLEALEQLQAMRRQEGTALGEDMYKHCRVINENLQYLKQMTDMVLEKYHQRLQQRVNTMLAEVNLRLDEELLLKEVALFAERSDVNEEISRLESHLQQFENFCKSNEPAGRRLDFLTQEMLREANTIASKANDARISRHVVEIKVGIDRLKEQVQNVE